MDFVTGFFESRVYGKTYDVILVIINNFFKIIYYIFCRKDFTAGDLAELIIKKIIRFYEIFLIIVSNRGNLFISRLWANLIYIFKVQRRLNTAFYLQIDN